MASECVPPAMTRAEAIEPVIAYAAVATPLVVAPLFYAITFSVKFPATMPQAGNTASLLVGVAPVSV